MTALVLVGAALVGFAGSTVAPPRSVAQDGDVPLYSEGVSLAADGAVSLVPAGTVPSHHPGSRVSRSVFGDRSAETAAVLRQQEWLAAGRVPGGSTRYADMSRAALLDLETLLQPNGAAVAAWSASWRYVWPRDASFVAAALARSGHRTDAFDVLAFLQSVQERGGRFHARYLPSGGGVPDDRGEQLDGAGWVLWGTRQWVDSFGPGGVPPGQLRALGRLVRSSTAGLLDVLDPRTGLPPVSSDYWERDEDTLTLGTAAPVLAGLRAAPPLLEALGDPRLAARARTAAARLHRAVTRTFGARGYPREIDGTDRDAAVAFLLPPFAATAGPGVLRAWRAAGREMLQPAGGLSPGTGWKRDGISWTPETALFALTAAAGGDDPAARAWLDWLDGHRTAMGSLPEKVTAAGRPAAVAPLAWTAALVLLTLDELDAGTPD